jgi:type III pantothenate kinase
MSHERLLIVIDVGNTNTVVGLYRGDELLDHFRLSTEPERTDDEYGALMLPLLSRQGIDPADADAILISSVVPTLSDTLERLSRKFFACEPVFVAPGIRTGLVIRNENPAEVGADRIVNAVAALELYGAPVVVVDFGTATTFDVLNAAGEYVGGVIAPGIAISAEALFSQASRLYRVDVRRPEKVVGRNTATAMQSGIYFGAIGLVDGLLDRIKAEMPGIERVVATGGHAPLVAEGSRHIDEVNSNLTLLGLKLIDERNR